MTENASKHKGGGGWIDPAGGLRVIVIGLLCLGGLMVYSAGAAVDQQIRLDRFWEFATIRRLLFVPVCLLILFIAGHWDLPRMMVWRKPFWLSPIHSLMLLSLALLVLVMIPSIGTSVNESRRWLRVTLGAYQLTFQPSELAKWVTVMFLAAYASWQGAGMRSFLRGFLPTCFLLLLVVGLIGIEDFGTGALIGIVGLSMLLAAGWRWWHVLCLIPAVGAAFYFLVYGDAYRWHRIMAFFYPEQASETAYHAQQSIMAIGVGGLWGTGLGQGTVKLGWLPEDTTDFVFAVIGEELGLFGVGIVVVLYASFIVLSMMVVWRTQEPFRRLLALGVSLMIATQAAMNLFVVTAMAPTKGIALPLVSAGGSGLVLTTLAAGVLIHIAEKARSTTEAPGRAADSNDYQTSRAVFSIGR